MSFNIIVASLEPPAHIHSHIFISFISYISFRFISPCCFPFIRFTSILFIIFTRICLLFISFASFILSSFRDPSCIGLNQGRLQRSHCSEVTLDESSKSPETRNIYSVKNTTSCWYSTFEIGLMEGILIFRVNRRTTMKSYLPNK